ncbi:unnamed protein product [Nezara viridula]|uniref:Uncharacterized protein n=1 Tax=Nezara viridula TaxID=85310 RepID=A0A9P0MR24_NEZVI|nr:unnamed protein product [Nezara viridula]
MKTLFALLAAASCCLAAAVPYTPAGPKAQGALLLLPHQQAKDNNNSTSTTPRFVTNGTDNLEDVNAKLSERLRQQQGSEQGAYHVYLQDGRLQKVQYITAPITSGQQTQQQQYASNNYNQQQQTPEILSPDFADKRGAYFVQVPQERIQAYQNYARQASQQTAQFQNAAASSQYREDPTEQAVVRYLPVPLTEEVGQYSGKYTAGEQYYGQQQQYSTGEQQAVVQYSEVQPIQGPVYSYSPQEITRILRYAPVY